MNILGWIGLVSMFSGVGVLYWSIPKEKEAELSSQSPYRERCVLGVLLVVLGLVGLILGLVV